jgi:hypothetical protein
MDAHRDSIRYWFRAGLISLFLFFSCSETEDRHTGSVPLEHDLWNVLLKTHVSDSGKVDYAGIKRDSTQFYQYINLLRKAHPDKNTWSREERLAYWINAYNAFTVQLIIENYPLESIKDLQSSLAVPFINSVWDEVFINIEGNPYSLNDIEHRILRKKFNEPRIHFAINCASGSCPVLRAEAYDPAKIEDQLQEQAILFINDGLRNQIAGDRIRISRIFQWFSGDFTKNGGIIDYLNQFSEVHIDEDADIGYLEYDWSLNE